MINLISTKLIYRPIKQIFDFTSTPENDFQWQYGTLKSARISEGSMRVGTFIRSIGHFMGHRIEGTFEVTEYEPNQKYGFKSLSGPLHSQTLYTFEIAGGGTKVKHTVISPWIKAVPVSQGSRFSVLMRLTTPGYNDDGTGHRILYVGGEPKVADSTDTINKFLAVMDFDTNADRTNAVAAALTGNSGCSSARGRSNCRRNSTTIGSRATWPGVSSPWDRSPRCKAIRLCRSPPRAERR